MTALKEGLNLGSSAQQAVKTLTTLGSQSLLMSGLAPDIANLAAVSPSLFAQLVEHLVEFDSLDLLARAAASSVVLIFSSFLGLFSRAPPRRRSLAQVVLMLTLYTLSAESSPAPRRSAI